MRQRPTGKAGIASQRAPYSYTNAPATDGEGWNRFAAGSKLLRSEATGEKHKSPAFRRAAQELEAARRANGAHQSRLRKRLREPNTLAFKHSASGSSCRRSATRAKSTLSSRKCRGLQRCSGSCAAVPIGSSGKAPKRSASAKVGFNCQPSSCALRLRAGKQARQRCPLCAVGCTRPASRSHESSSAPSAHWPIRSVFLLLGICHLGKCQICTARTAEL